MNDPSFLLTLQCTLQCMLHAQNIITDTQTFTISKLGGWKHTTAFHKSSDANRHPEVKHIRQYSCYGNRSVIGTEKDGRPFRIGVTLACLQQAGKLPRRTSRQNTTPIRGAITSAVLLKKEEIYPMGQSPHEAPSLTRNA